MKNRLGQIICYALKNIEKPINHRFDAFIDITLNNKSTRSHLVNYPNKKNIIKNKLRLIFTVLLPITFDIILIPKICSKNLINHQICIGTLHKN